MAQNKTEKVVIPMEVAQEYAAKLLGFEPLQLSDDLYNTILTHIGQMIDAFQKKLLEKCISSSAKRKVEKLINYFIQKLEDCLADKFHSIDVLLATKLFYLHPSVVLKDDEPQLDYSEKLDKSIQDKILTHTRRISVLKRCLIKIKQEIDQINSVIETIRNMKNRIRETVEDVYNVKSIEELCLRVSERNDSINRLYTAVTTNANLSDDLSFSMKSSI
ncbi:unnamed protein product [Heterobilharzia americana]|nr:unnamed protein product [Heterobilharzia americana]CAH8446412.1 unnamed protein product [Heterobilharzia americana]